MRLFDTHPPSDVSVDRSLSESLCSAVSQKTPLAMSSTNSSQRDFKSGLRGVKLEDSSHGVRSAWRNPMLHSSRLTWRKPVRSSDRGGAESDAFCHESKLEGRKRHKESLYRSSVDKLRKESSLFPRSHSRKRRRWGPQWSTSPQTLSSSWTPLPEARWFLTAEGHFLFEDDYFESFTTGNMGNGESDRLNLGKDPSSKKRTFSPTLFGVWEEARCGKLQINLKAGGQTIAKKADQAPQEATTPFFECEVNIQPGFTSSQVLTTIKQHISSTLDDFGPERVPETYPPPHHLHGDDERTSSGSS